ncbi:hypothetical protein Tco_0405588 [Tanacetum coccineum]
MNWISCTICSNGSASVPEYCISPLMDLLPFNLMCLPTLVHHLLHAVVCLASQMLLGGVGVGFMLWGGMKSDCHSWNPGVDPSILFLVFEEVLRFEQVATSANGLSTLGQSAARSSSNFLFGVIFVTVSTVFVSVTAENPLVAGTAGRCGQSLECKGPLRICTLSYGQSTIWSCIQCIIRTVIASCAYRPVAKALVDIIP